MNFSKVLSFGSAIIFLILVGYQIKFGFTSNTTVLSVVLVVLAFLKDSEFTRGERVKMQKEFSETKSELEQQLKKLSEELDVKNTQLKDRVEYLNSQLGTLKITSGIKTR
jgi:small-conductance mechanosensitive channel